MKETVVHEKDLPGVFILDGKVKIRKIDKYNYCIFVKDDKCIGKKKSKNRDKEGRGEWVYHLDGYRRIENYFSDVPSAVRWYMKKEFTEGFDGDLIDLVKRLEEVYDKIAEETSRIETRVQ